MAKRKQIKKAVKQAASGGITKKELTKIVKQTQAPVQQVIRQMDVINRNAKQADKPAPVSLNSGAANMLIKQLQGQPADPFGRTPSMGTGNIAKALQGMIGTTPYTAGRNPQSGAPYGGSTPAVPGTGLMIGGTEIRPGGRVAVRTQPVGAAPAAPPPPPGPGDGAGAGAGDGAGDGAGAGDDFDLQSYIDDLMSTFATNQADQMANLSNMFNTQFEQLSSKFDTQDPLQLAGLGKSYMSDAIRARRRQPKTRTGYMRNAFGPTAGNPFGPLAALSIGGLTL